MVKLIIIKCFMIMEELFNNRKHHPGRINTVPFHGPAGPTLFRIAV